MKLTRDGGGGGSSPMWGEDDATLCPNAFASKESMSIQRRKVIDVTVRAF